MTRSRAIGNVPTEIVAKYYAQRAEGGAHRHRGHLAFAGRARLSAHPGPLQRGAGRGLEEGVTQAVHAAGSHIFVQLMHTGRVSHPRNLAPGGVVRGPSAVAAPDPMWVDAEGKAVPVPVPTVMTEADIERAIGEYAQSAALAIEAGFDGVELHGANGYLIDQFLNTASNQRTDSWGGSTANRVRFALEVARRTAERIGADRLGIRISPYGVFNGMQPDAAMEQLYTELARGLSALKLAYIHIVDHSSLGAPALPESIKPAIRAAFNGKIILSGGYDRERAEKDLEAKRGDLVAFGRPFLSNPKLVSKLRDGSPLTPPDFATFYTPGEKGYTDFV